MRALPEHHSGPRTTRENSQTFRASIVGRKKVRAWPQVAYLRLKRVEKPPQPCSNDRGRAVSAQVLHHCLAPLARAQLVFRLPASKKPSR
jgi:hypothetical protein